MGSSVKREHIGKGTKSVILALKLFHLIMFKWNSCNVLYIFITLTLYLINKYP